MYIAPNMFIILIHSGLKVLWLGLWAAHALALMQIYPPCPEAAQLERMSVAVCMHMHTTLDILKVMRSNEDESYLEGSIHQKQSRRTEGQLDSWYELKREINNLLDWMIIGPTIRYLHPGLCWYFDILILWDEAKIRPVNPVLIHRALICHTSVPYCNWCVDVSDFPTLPKKEWSICIPTIDLFALP